MSQVQSLAYVVVESTNPAAWKEYGERMLGMRAADAPAGGLWLKMDERPFRIAVVEGERDAYRVSGWEVASARDFDQLLSALAVAGVATQRAEPALCAQRCVKDLVSFSDPAGNRLELSWGPVGKTASFVSPIGVGGFKTGPQGLGHTVLPAIPFDETLKFYREVLGFGLSDVFNFQPGPDAPVMRIYFLHGACGRHHSVALAEMPNPAGCVHMMVEVNSMTEVGLAHDRAVQQGVKFMATLGEHENDRMTSFYIMTPGGFALEYGWGGIEVDPKTWKTTETKRVSIWGHDFSVGFR
jgi:3,4-dihydroxy-9,10-secoandrosta-1,3,5(10)-triene-9,17-dione 4,5-dioxygenase